MHRDYQRKYHDYECWMNYRSYCTVRRIISGLRGILLASMNQRVNKVIAITPPFINSKVAIAAPKNIVPIMANTSTLLITVSDDEYANQVENNLLISGVANQHKQRIDFDSAHILPAHYVEQLDTFLKN